MKTDIKNETQQQKPTMTRKVISYSLVAAMLHASVAPAIASTAQKKQQEAAQAAHAQAINKDDAVTQMIELAAKNKLNVEFIKETEAKKRAGRNIFSRMVDGVIELFTDNSEEVALDDANDSTATQLLALETQAAKEHAELINELKQQKATYQEKGFDAQSLQEQDQLIAEMNSRYDVLKGLMANLKTAKNDSAKDNALAALNKQLTDWQPKVAYTDMDNLPWGTPKNDVREPIVAEQSDINKVSFQNNKNNHLNTAVGQWRETEYKIGNYLLNKNPIQKANAGALSGMTAAGNWPVLKALPKEVQPADLEANQDVQINDDIKALAAELDHSPAKIYKWVHDNIEFVPTYGSIQGSAFTLETKRGNATDTASLLIALYRASGIPARYVYGTVDIPAKFAMNWVGGVDDIFAAGNLIGQGGIPHTVIMNASVPKYLRMEHVWVEANVDYVGSRGHLSADKTTNNDKQWIPLDASYKSYTRTKGIDFSAEVKFDAEKLAEDLKKDTQINENTGFVENLDATLINDAIQDYQYRVDAYINQNNPNATVGDLLGENTINPYKSDTLAPMLPYQVKTVVSDYQELPDKMRHYFIFNLYENVGFLGNNDYGLPLYEYKIASSELQGKPLSFSWTPESDAEEEKLLNTATEENLPINVWMSPELRLGDTILKKEGRFRLGYDIKVRYGFQSPNSGVSSVVNKDMVTGEYHAIGYNMQGISQKQIDRNKATLENAQQKLQSYEASQDESVLDGITQHDITGAMLQATVQNYFATNDTQADIHQSQADIVQNSYMSFGTFSTSLFTIYRYGLPFRTVPSGMTMDIDRIRHQTVHKANDAKSVSKYLEIQGQRESANENFVPEKFFEQSYGISAAAVLDMAAEDGQTIYSLNFLNKDEILPKLSAHSAQTLADVKNALNSGKEVTISERPIEFYGWKGSGYIIIDTVTGAGAYMLEGGTNGGWLKKVCRQKIKHALKGMLKGAKFVLKGVAASLAFSAVTSFIVKLANSAVELNDCHKKLISSVLSALEGISLMYDVLSFLRFSGFGAVLLYASMPIAIYPVIAAATIGMTQCNATSARALFAQPVYAARAAANGGVGTCAFPNGYGKPKNALKNWVNKDGKVEYRDPFDGKRKLFPDDVKPSIDHILPQKEFKKIINNTPGLTSQQKKDLIKKFRTDPDNLQPLPKNLNSSKGSKVESKPPGWDQYKKTGEKVSDNYKKYLADAQQDVRDKIDQAIKDLLG